MAYQDLILSGNTSTANLLGATSTVQAQTPTNQTGTIPVSFLSTSTIGAAISGALSTTSTVPVSFATTSTVQSIQKTGPVSFADGYSNAGNQPADSAGQAITPQVYPVIFNSTTWDRMRSTQAVSGGTMAAGLLANGNLAYDGSAWRPVLVDSNGVLKTASTTVTVNTTSTFFNYTTTASTLLALNTGRNYAIIRNYTSGTALVGLGSVPSTANVNASIFLLQNEAYEIVNTNLFRGTINIVGLQAGTISAVEW